MRLYAKFEGSLTIVSIFRAILARFVLNKNGPKMTPEKFRFFLQKVPIWALFGKKSEKKFSPKF